MTTKFYHRLLIATSLTTLLIVFNQSLLLSQNTTIITPKSYFSLLSESEIKIITVANNDAYIADSIFNDADSIQKLMVAQENILSSGESNSNSDLNKQMNYLFVKALELHLQSNNAKIGVFKPKIPELKSNMGDDSEYYVSINKLQYKADSLADYSVFLENEIIYESDTNIILDKLSNAFQVGKDAIKNYKEIFTLYKIIKATNIEELTSSSDGVITDTAEENHVIIFKKGDIAIGDGDPAKYVQVIVNEKVVETIKVHQANATEDTLADIFSITSFDIDLILKAIENYVEEVEDLSYYPEDESPIEEVPIEDSDQDLAIITVEDTNNESTENTINEGTENIELTLPDTEKTITDQPIIDNISDEKTVYTETKVDNIIIDSTEKKLVFRVQIAADRVPLNDKKLKSIYKGNKEIKMFQEEEWYKYYIEDCPTLREAIVLRKQSKVSDAFIMAYYNGKKIPFFLKYVKSPEVPTVLRKGFRDLAKMSDDKVIIVVQITASEVELDHKELKKLYEGPEEINFIREEGWYKYSIGNFDKFLQANRLRKKCGIDDAFVVAYKNGIKHDLWAKYKKDKK